MISFKSKSFPKFSERRGLIQPKTDFQVDSIDENLRTGLWNLLLKHCFKNDSPSVEGSSYKDFVIDSWINHFHLPFDNLPLNLENAFKEIRYRFFKLEWFEVYDFIEFLSSLDCFLEESEFKEDCNRILETHLSAFRLIEGIFSPIIDKGEIREIEDSIKNTGESDFLGTSTHLEASLKKLSDKQNPDYRNSIKESISAVESLVRIIVKKEKATLPEALDELEKEIKIHPALKSGFDKLYGYTSDEDGIRHAILDQKDISIEDARYMLISCSAFINYLLVKANKAKIRLIN